MYTVSSGAHRDCFAKQNSKKILNLVLTIFDI